MHRSRDKHPRPRVLIGAAVGAILVLMTLAAPAQAATHSGDKACSDTLMPRLYLDSRVTFPAGASQRNSPYQNTHWWVYASQSFYYPPYATCVQ